MPDPVRTDSDRPADAGPVDRDARIEQLLLAGLDHYFAHDYEGAINVWTRVAFLERGHSRARAYIERARGALAEQQRESEELLHRGVDAFNRGDTDNARLLINQAIEQIGPNDVALVLLERLNRLAPSQARQEGQRLEPAGLNATRPESQPVAPSSRVRSWLLAAIGLLAVVGVVALAGLGLEAWFLERSTPGTDRAPVLREEPLPIVRSAELALARARFLYGGGHLRDALLALDAIGVADPLRPEADALRAEIQRHVLDAARPPANPLPPAPAGSR